MRLMWATRGRSWGFRFVRDGGFSDPLPIYEACFSTIKQETDAFLRMEEIVALRFADPEGRRDRAGRVIRHDFVVFGSLAEQIESLETGLEVVWGCVADDFARVWDLPEPPTDDT